MEVHTTCRTLVKPSIPTPTHLQELRPSSLDQLQPNVYMPILLHYHVTGGVVLEKINQLKESLSETLSVFYPLAGRYGEAGDVINCNDQGVEFVEAKVKGKLDQFVPDGGGHSYEMLLALPSSSAITPGSSLPLVAFKVNVFECGGLVVGVQMNHIAVDMFSICTFMKVWATTSRQGTLQVVPPDFELPRLFPPKDLKNIFEESMLEAQASHEGGKKTTSKRFSFKNKGLSGLRDEVTTTLGLSDKGSDCKKHPSRVELLTALICKVVMSIDRMKFGRSRPLTFVHSINLRGRTALPVKEDVFGNFYIIAASAPLMTNNDIGPELFRKLVKWVADTLRNAINEYGKVKDCKELTQKSETCEKEFHEIAAKGETNLALFGSWCRYSLYGIDYGWGRPTMVGTGKAVVGNVFFFMDAESGDGIDAWVTLEDDDMNYFEQDPDILKCTMSAASSVRMQQVD